MEQRFGNILKRYRMPYYDSGSESDDSLSCENSSSNFNHQSTTLWVFGYGSLCWNPGFDYLKCVTGYIRGYVRRFWQGNTTHRGTKDKPGRVATLVENKDGITWGCAYKISGAAALSYLRQRECTLGGYITEYTKFYPRVATENSAEICGEAFPALLYIATNQNCHWLGEETIDSIAQQISECRGPSGHNAEYLLRLAKFMRDEIDEVVDDHLFELERKVKEIMHCQKISLTTVMGNDPQRIHRDSHEEIRRPNSFEYASRVPDVKLRCLHI